MQDFPWHAVLFLFCCFVFNSIPTILFGGPPWPSRCRAQAQGWIPGVGALEAWAMAKEEEREVGTEWSHQGQGRRVDHEEGDQGRRGDSGSDGSSQSHKPCREMCVGQRCGVPQ